MHDAYDTFDNNEIANEREADSSRRDIWEAYIVRHADGATDPNRTVDNLLDAIAELQHENEQLREGIRRERTDSEISWTTAETYMEERDKALVELENARHWLREAEDREVRYIRTISKIRAQMMSAYAEIAADLAARSPELVHAVTVPLELLPANRAA